MREIWVPGTQEPTMKVSGLMCFRGNLEKGIDSRMSNPRCYSQVLGEMLIGYGYKDVSRILSWKVSPLKFVVNVFYILSQ